jgi:hypothetical protein
MTARRSTNPDRSPMKAAFLLALRDRVARDQDGEIVLPTGVAGVAEIGRVLGAIDRSRHEARRREGERR